MEKSPFLMEKIPCRYFFQKKVRNASEKHLNGEISIQNGDFSILNGENSLLGFVLKEGSKRFSKAAAKYIIISLNRTTEHW